MALTAEQDLRKSALFEVAKQMATAARTAPKGHGTDNLAIAIADGEKIKQLSDKLKQMTKEEGAAAFFARDGENILKAEALLLIGTKIEPLGISNCGLCGFENCDAKRKHPDVPCAFNTNDLGIATGSAAAVAMDARVDNRIMFTVGKAARALNLLGDEIKIIMGIPLSCLGKNPFFDRK